MKPSDAKTLIRKNFSRSAKTYDASASLQREVADLLLARLAYLKNLPQTILEGGCGTGYVTRRMATYCPKSFVVASDAAFAMVEEARRQDRRWFKKAHYCLADMEALPFANHSFDAFICSLALQWCNPQKVFAEVYRILKPNGFILFSTLGPDTLCELKEALNDTRVHGFIDMHDLGSLLTEAGFADPVLDCEWQVRHYATIENLLREIKGLGAMSILPGRRSLGGKQWLEQLKINYEKRRMPQGLPATYEVVFGQAWVADSKSRAREITIPLDQVRRMIK